MSYADLPRWDTQSVYPSLDSSEFTADFAALVSDIAGLGRLFDQHDVRKRASSEASPAFLASYEEVTAALNALIERVHTIGTYIMCFVTTDASDDLARSRESELDEHGVLLQQLGTRYTAWTGTSDVDGMVALSAVARANEYELRRAQEEAQHQMPEGEESLAAQLGPCGISAWAKLHGMMTATLTTKVEVNGEMVEMPMSRVRSLAGDPDRETRRRAYEAEIAAWETIATPMAAALNGIKGWQRSLRSRRGHADDVEPTLFNNGIDAATLEAMQSACVESFPDFRRYMAAKARALRVPKLAWYDISAPLATGDETWGWADAEDFVIENFSRYSERMADFARMAFRDRWIDAGPRVGKVGGAYCAGIRPGESRILMNFDGSFTAVSTLAHELGHAYHNLNMRDRQPLQRGTPSTMAETASIFCETLAFDAAIAEAEQEERLSLLETTLQRDLQVVVDIHSRFLFEKAVFERRGERDLTVHEFCDIMLDAQRQTYGPALDPLHPYMWVVKGHYYGPTFYNYPYTFGLLFGIGLYAQYKADPEGFRSEYDDFLSSTGMADAATLGRRFGADITDVAFWRAGLDVVRQHVADFEELVD